MTKHVLGAIIVCLGLAGCESGNGCLPALSSNAHECGANIFIDASVNDPLCLGNGGEPICRGSADAVCYMCNGGSFSDGCLIHGPTTYECVHSCSSC
jgi:hypothetical protein